VIDKSARWGQEVRGYSAIAGIIKSGSYRRQAGGSGGKRADEDVERVASPITVAVNGRGTRNIRTLSAREHAIARHVRARVTDVMSRRFEM